MNKDMTPQEVAEKWAAELQRIYSSKTAGDHTFIGVLYHFYTEMKKRNAEMISPHEPTPANDDVMELFRIRYDDSTDMKRIIRSAIMLGAHIGTLNQLDWEEALSYWLANSKLKNG